MMALLPGIAVVAAFAVVRVSDGSLAGGFGLVGLALFGFSITAGVLLAWRLLSLQQRPERLMIASTLFLLWLVAFVIVAARLRGLRRSADALKLLRVFVGFLGLSAVVALVVAPPDFGGWVLMALGCPLAAAPVASGQGIHSLDQRPRPLRSLAPPVLADVCG